MENFVKRTERLERSSWAKRIAAQGGTDLSMSFGTGGSSMSHNLPNEEELDAFLLTGRMFVQNNDPVSFGNMGKLEGDPDVSEGWKDRVRNARAELNGYLDSASNFNIDGVARTHRDIFKIFLYGGLAHTDATLAPIYELWKSNPLGYPLIEQRFHGILGRIMYAATYLAHFTRLELAGETLPDLTEVPPIVIRD